MDLERIMRKISLIFAVVLIAGIASGCSSGGAGDNSEPVSEPETVSQMSIADVSDANVALAEGSRLLDENQTERAIEFLEHAVSLNPDLAEGYFQLGIAYSLLELQYEQEGVITEAPSNTNSGRTKKRSERSFERAVDAYEKWIEANPEDDSAHFDLGRTYSKLMKDEEAEKAFEQAVKLKPEDSEYQTELGAIRIKLAKYHEAIAPLKEAIELDAENVRAEELLEEAEAGRRRLDFISPRPDANRPSSNTRANSNAAVESNSDSGTQRPTNTGVKPPPSPAKKPTPAFNRPN